MRDVQFFVFGLLSFAKIAKFAKIITPKVIYFIDYSLVCEECEDFYYGDCPVHGSLLPLADKTDGYSDTNKSQASLPDGLEIRESNIPDAGLGVFAMQPFECGIRFGPYQGKKMRCDIPKVDFDTSYMWEVLKSSNKHPTAMLIENFSFFHL